MKKSLLGAALLLLIIAFLPTIGNTFIKKTIDDRLEELASYGLQTNKDESSTTYLNTSRHFEFLLKDSEQFLEYLQQYSDKQLPPYVNAMFEGVLIGADVEYSNFPFVKSFEIEIYPMQLSPMLSKELQEKDINIYEKVKQFLGLKGLLYHIEYNLLNDDFKGYVKDINELFTLKDASKVSLTLNRAKFKGNGVLLAPDELHSSVKKMQIKMQQNEKSFSIVLKDLKSSTDFDSAHTYLTSVDLKSMFMSVEGLNNDMNISIHKLRANASSNEQGSSIELYSKTSIKELSLDTQTESFNMQNFNFDIALNGLEKQAYQTLTELLAQKDMLQSPQSSEAIQETLVNLLSKGLVINIVDLSLKKYSAKKMQEIKGFKLQSSLMLKEDKDLDKKIKQSPLLVIQNMLLDSELILSKEMYNTLVKYNPMIIMLDGYKKEDGDNYIFKFLFKDAHLSVNGQNIN